MWRHQIQHLRKQKVWSGLPVFFIFNVKLLWAFPWHGTCRNYSNIQKCFYCLPRSFGLFWILSPYWNQFSSLQLCNGDLHFVDECVIGQVLQSLSNNSHSPDRHFDCVGNHRIRCRKSRTQIVSSVASQSPVCRHPAEPHHGPTHLDTNVFGWVGRW